MIIVWFEKNYILSWIITFFLAGFIFYMSSISFQTIPGPKVPFESYIYHMMLFFILSFFLSISIIKGDYNKKHLILISVLIAIAYGISDELHQLFVPFRCCALDDAVTDSVGIIFAAVFYTSNLIWRRKRNFHPN